MTRLVTPPRLHHGAGRLDASETPAEGVEVGCRESAELVYRQYATRIYAVAFRMLGSATDAEDVTQEVLLQVVRRLDSFRGESSLHTWLYRVTVNAVLALRRKRAGGREHPLGDDAGRPAGRSLPAQPPEAHVLGGELRDRLDGAIRCLPEAYRDPFVLADVEQLPNAEIGRLLGLSLPAVKSRLHRARLMLRDALQPYFAEWRTPQPPRGQAVGG